MNDIYSGATPPQIRVWDLPVRIFHWLMAFSFAGAYLTAEADNWRQVHVTLGYTMAALVCFRILWGFFGTYYARFASFVRGPKATLSYLRSMLHGRPQHFTGHNPAGAVAIVLMLGIAMALAGSGWLLYTERAGEWMEDVHELIANLMLAVVLVHIAGVLVASFIHRENLAKSMLTGRKHAAPGVKAQGLRTGTALLLLLAVLALWWWQGSHADAPAAGREAAEHTRS
ncbi:cytochrome B [Duganella sp. BJB488]|uniref:cytochrome b/b6 domain-containing protein n=1 Tax=unclassified Duganella TaxID=2636909 RepID=UPI000E347057|nr:MULTISPECIES: cytochrome b/b6 domain-containing protein [unclassified Duganella]RFP24292.1 cytochrome B [Duganella sp. BJB489]RFP26653.1 cytochrome B [Duganella sp. BJB488]RFP34614.1 cytochrome B [Duganella sp. BJB480]